MAGLVFITWLAACFTCVLGTCRFPSTMYDTYTSWQIKSPDYKSTVNHLHRLVTVDDERITFDYITKINPEEAGLTFTYICEEALANNTFLVSVVKVGKQPLYTCLEFVIRDINVVQLKYGETSPTKSTSLCFDAPLVLLDSPLVYYRPSPDFWSEKRNSGQQYKPCPIEGGYVVAQIYDEDNKPLCTGPSVPPLKVENECEKGEGLLFHHVGGKRSDACPELPKDIKLEQFCLANWTHGENTFMVVLSMTDTSSVACIRYGSKHGDTFSMYVFYDGVCDHSEDVSESHQYRRFSLERFPVSQGICGDESPDCAVPDPSPLCSQGDANQVCRGTCQVCPEHGPWEHATNPPEFQGEWMKHTQSHGQETVVIDARTLTVPSFGTYRTYGESECWSAREMISESAREYIMVQDFNNGCSPRVTVIQLAARSKAVISIKMSNPSVVLPELTYIEAKQKWLIQDGWEWWCLRTDYRAAPVNQGEQFRPGPSNWHNLVTTHPNPPTVHCNMSARAFRITLPSGDVCTANVINYTNHTFDLSFPSCKTDKGLPTHTHPSRASFLCLASFTVEYSSRLMVTKTTEGSGNIADVPFLCWVFSSEETGVVSWMRVSECDSSSDYYVRIGLRQPLLQLRITDPEVSSANALSVAGLTITLVIITKILTTD